MSAVTSQTFASARPLRPWEAASSLAAAASRERGLIGASLTRILLGLWAVYYYLLHLPVRGFLWGPQGVWPYERFLAEGPVLNIWVFARTAAAGDLLYAAAIIVAGAYALGFQSRVSGPLHWLMISSLQDRNPFITDGGDNIMRIVLLFLVLVNTGAHFSIDAMLRARRGRSRERAGGDGDGHQTPWRAVLGVLHNAGLALVVLQMCLLYFSTGLYKVMGAAWQQGTALYYILRVEEFSWPGVAQRFYQAPSLVVLGTYATVLFELLFTPLLLNRWTRYLVLLAGVGFHIGITLFMGLLTFGWSMLATYPLFLTDGEYASVGRILAHRWGLTVLYDGWCPFCRRSVAWLSRLDLAGLLRFVSFRDPGVAAAWGVDPIAVERRIHAVDRSGRTREGIDAMLQIAWRTVTLWPLVPVLLLCRLIAGQRVYDWVATRRLILVPGRCDIHCPAGQRSDPARGPSGPSGPVRPG